MGDDTSIPLGSKLLCECCRTDRPLSDIWWCSVCQGTLCGTCAMKGHREHQCNPWENLDVVQECLQFYQSFIRKRAWDNEIQLESIRAFCTNLENHLVDYVNQEIKAREGVRRITNHFSLLTEKNDNTSPKQPLTVPQKIEKKLRVVSNLLQSHNMPGLDDLSFDLYDDKRDYEFELPKLEKVVDLCFVRKGVNEPPRPTPVQITPQTIPLGMVQNHNCQFNFKSWLLPIAVALAITFVHPLIFADPLYSTQMTNKHTEQRRTQSLQVPYYVKPDFLQHVNGDLAKLEEEIEEIYVDSIRTKCFNERKTKETTMWKSKLRRDVESFDKAKYMKTPNCERLSDLLVNKL